MAKEFNTVTTVNYHLLKQCNMSCGFCFATFLDTSSYSTTSLSRDDALQLINLLSEAGFGKINFAGGEPTLCRWLPDLIRAAKHCRLTTSIVTNGSRITGDWLDKLAGCLDIAALSIDSVDADTLRHIGRTPRGREPMRADEYRRRADWIKERDIRLKVNTVVSSANYTEDFRPFIQSLRPERWKIFQTLPVRGQNDARIDEFIVSGDQFEQYVRRNRTVANEGIRVVREDNALMTGSYAMVDPLGRFFDNTEGEHTYSRPILEVGVAVALGEVSISAERFDARGGNYA